jgi:hypothetical protein
MVQTNLCGQIYDICQHENENFMDTVDRLISKVNEFSAAGGVLPDKEAGSILMRIVPREYSPTIQMLVTKAELEKKPFSFNDVLLPSQQ